MCYAIAVGQDITLSLSWDDRIRAQVNPDWQTVSGTLEVVLRPAGGQLSGLRDILVTAEALIHFDNELSRLLDDLTGSATLEPQVDYDGGGDFELTVRLKYGKGTVSGFLATVYHGARLTFDGVEIDQSYLAETQRQLRRLLSHRP